MPQQPSDFSKGKVSKNILQLAVPMIFAQLVNVLYSVVDRMYIGHMPESASAALAGIGLTFPIISIVTAFANLFGTGGTPLFSIARGEDNTDRARYIMGSTFVLLVITGLALTLVGLLCKRPILYLFSASEATFPFANDYLSIYLCGSVFVMLSLGMNGFINAQGFGRKGMLTVVLGAVTNIVLDPLFIFVFELGVKGAAIATVISQFISALWAIGFLYRRAPILLRKADMHPSFSLVREITVLGFSGFIVNVTNSSVQIVCNATLRAFGGDLYVGVMTIINSVREVAFAPINGLTGATQPVLGFNYGAKEYGRVRQGIRYMSILMCFLHHWHLALHFALAGIFHSYFHFGQRFNRSRYPLHAYILFRLFHDGAAIGRANGGRGAWPFKAGHFLLAFAKGLHRHPADAVLAASVPLGGHRRFPRRTHFQFLGRRCVFYHHDFYHLERTRPFGTGKTIRLFCRLTACFSNVFGNKRDFMIK